jgi:glycerol-3-phosphate acyltransferase PlsX
VVSDTVLCYCGKDVRRHSEENASDTTRSVRHHQLQLTKCCDIFYIVLNWDKGSMDYGGIQLKIIIDGMGGDFAPQSVVEGAVKASAHTEHEMIIVGDEAQISALLAKHKYKGNNIKVVHASQVITNEEAPVKAVRTKQDSSMVRGLNMLKEGQGDLFISAGNTGALMAGGLFILGRIQGIDRPAIASIYPVVRKEGGVSLLVDAGANSECKPNNLLEFAAMGSIYMEQVLNVENPTVGLVNIGSEENKGTTVLKAAYELLSKSRLNFIGNVEARDVPKGSCNVIVCDGFVGNVILKLTEGLAWSIMKLVKNKITTGILSKIGAILLLGKLKELKSDFDYSEYGGAPILGVKGAVLKIHGSSSARAVKNAILKGIPYAEHNVVQTIENAVLELEEIITSE